jgi:hypothetical protein
MLEPACDDDGGAAETGADRYWGASAQQHSLLHPSLLAALGTSRGLGVVGAPHTVDQSSASSTTAAFAASSSPASCSCGRVGQLALLVARLAGALESFVRVVGRGAGGADTISIGKYYSSVAIAAAGGGHILWPEWLRLCEDVADLGRACCAAGAGAGVGGSGGGSALFSAAEADIDLEAAAAALGRLRDYPVLGGSWR